MSHKSDSDLDEKIEILKLKYLQKKSQLVTGAGAVSSDEAGVGVRRQISRILSERLKRRADSDENQSVCEDEESNVFCTETDVTLPSDLARSSGSPTLSRTLRVSSSSQAAVHVYQEMLHIYEKLQAERLSQQAWAADLCERERDLQMRENRFLQQQHNLHKTNRLEAALKQKTLENSRMKKSFDAIREMNESMRKQLNELGEQNKKLENQSRRLQARLENLQRKYESFSTYRKPEAAALKPERAEPAPVKPAAECSRKLLVLLLHWVIKDSLRENQNPSKALHERCSKALPLLLEQLHHIPDSDWRLLSALLHCIYWSLLSLEHGTQQVVLSSTLRRLGEQVSRDWLLKSSCMRTRFLSSIILIRTIMDLVARALTVLTQAVQTEEGRELFVENRVISLLLALLSGAGSGSALQASVLDMLLLMSSHPVLGSVFLDQCSSEDFFRSASQFLRKPHLEPSLLEKMLTVLQKLSSMRKNKRLFEASSLHLLLQEMHRTMDRSQAFICMNLSSILLHLGMLSRS
ncbi:hypothetical protein DNTS_018996 [Danionella cerebrum]|uniref:Coiled-coil domain-containing protein 138 n=1 Tax=Danionella cerebrum TaxID=2873325 RepID=A0A553RJJ9_9TELE|nr:hypothetical protein DNTS_018996 [Danionella translucida]